MFCLIDTIYDDNEILLFATKNNDESNAVYCFRVCVQGTITVWVRLREKNATEWTACKLFETMCRYGNAAPRSYEFKKLHPFSGSTTELHAVVELRFDAKTNATHAIAILRKLKYDDCVFDPMLQSHQTFLMRVGLHPHGCFEPTMVENVQPQKLRRSTCPYEFMVLGGADSIKVSKGVVGSLPVVDLPILWMYWVLDHSEHPIACVLMWKGALHLFLDTIEMTKQSIHRLGTIFTGSVRDGYQWPDLVANVFDFIATEDPFILGGHDVVFGDLVDIMRQSANAGVFPRSLSRLRDPTQQIVGLRPDFAYPIGNGFAFTCPGRLILDTWLMLKKLDTKAKSANLHWLATTANFASTDSVIAARRAVSSNMLMSSTSSAHIKNCDAYADILITLASVPTELAALAEKWHMMETLCLFSQMSFSSRQEAQHATNSNTWRLILWNRSKQKGFYPWMDAYPEGRLHPTLEGGLHSTVAEEDVEEEVEDTDPVASIHVPPNIYRKVATFDFRSYYPSIIIAFNLCPSTIKRGSSPVDMASAIKFTSHGIEYAYEFTMNYVGIIPAELAQMMTLRAEAKREGTPRSKCLADVLKTLANSLWGLIGDRRFLFNDQGVAQVVSGLCRGNLISAVEIARQMKLELIYGVTDSVFVRGDDENEPQWREAYVNAVNAGMRAPVALQYEGDCDLLLISLSNMFVRDKDDKINVKGTFTARRDYPNIAAAFVKELASLVFNGCTREEFNEYVAYNKRTVISSAPLVDLCMYKHYVRGGLTSNMKTFFMQLFANGRHYRSYGEVCYVQTEEGPIAVEPGARYLRRNINFTHYEQLLDRDITNIARTCHFSI